VVIQKAGAMPTNDHLVGAERPAAPRCGTENPYMRPHPPAKLTLTWRTDPKSDVFGDGTTLAKGVQILTKIKHDRCSKRRGHVRKYYITTLLAPLVAISIALNCCAVLLVKIPEQLTS
jgi:hypothetical protein